MKFRLFQENNGRFNGWLRFQNVVTQDHDIASKNKSLDARELTSTRDLKSLQVE